MEQSVTSLFEAQFTKCQLMSGSLGSSFPVAFLWLSQGNRQKGRHWPHSKQSADEPQTGFLAEKLILDQPCVLCLGWTVTHQTFPLIENVPPWEGRAAAPLSSMAPQWLCGNLPWVQPFGGWFVIFNQAACVSGCCGRGVSGA